MRVDIYFRLKTNIFLNLDTSLFYPEPTYNITIIYNNILARIVSEMNKTKTYIHPKHLERKNIG